MDHRIGFIRIGYDADVVLWDSHPLALGATPRQVFIDGIAQFDSSYAPPALKPGVFQNPPKTPNYDKEAEETLKYEGLPPLEPEKSVAGTVIFTNVSRLWTRGVGGITSDELDSTNGGRGMVVVHAGRVLCSGTRGSCSKELGDSSTITVDLKGGVISPGLISFGSNLGLEEIQGEVSTKDGLAPDPLDKDAPGILGKGSFIRAIDGLQFATRHA